MKLLTPDDLLTVGEVAALLKVPPSWVYERTRRRTIPVKKLGHHVRIPRKELMAWVEKEGDDDKNVVFVPAVTTGADGPDELEPPNNKFAKKRSVSARRPPDS